MPDSSIYHMPPEWSRHERSFLEWPVKSSMVWPENYNEVCKGYAQVAGAIAEFEPVTVIADNDTEKEAAALCGEKAEITVIPHNDAWIRDNGPTFVYNDADILHGISWIFNAWGEKYTPFDLDNKVADRLLEHYKQPCINVPIVLEGGSIHVDGEGTLLTTEQCLLNKNRNPHLKREQIEEELKKHLGISKIIWLKRGLFGDETDGHIDNIACFAKPGTVIIQACHEKGDPNYEITQESLNILKNSSDAKGRKLEIIEIEQPPVRFYNDVRLTLSYLNFYFVNGGIILPVFGGDALKADENAVNILSNVFPDRKIRCVDGMALIKEGGNVHCITQQMPVISRNN